MYSVYKYCSTVLREHWCNWAHCVSQTCLADDVWCLFLCPECTTLQKVQCWNTAWLLGKLNQQLTILIYDQSVLNVMFCRFSLLNIIVNRVPLGFGHHLKTLLWGLGYYDGHFHYFLTSTMKLLTAAIKTTVHFWPTCIAGTEWEGKPRYWSFSWYCDQE